MKNEAVLQMCDEIFDDRAAASQATKQLLVLPGRLSTCGAEQQIQQNPTTKNSTTKADNNMKIEKQIQLDRNSNWCENLDKANGGGGVMRFRIRFFTCIE